jgi:hypothetical protein
MKEVHMKDAMKPERLQIILTPDELDALDDWRFAHRMPSRAAAIRELLKRGMAHEGGEAAGKIGRRSRDVRVLERRGNGAHMD